VDGRGKKKKKQKGGGEEEVTVEGIERRTLYFPLCWARSFSFLFFPLSFAYMFPKFDCCLDRY
jgi:hypothetical protein